jgi:pimeloyl-ACP methyl ester carboxylesterase
VTVRRILAVAGVFFGELLVAASAVVLVAGATASAALALAAGGLVELAAAAGGLRLALRRSRVRWRLVAAGAAGLVALSAFAVLVPSGSRPTAAAVPGQAFWDLPTGSRIRYVHLAARSRPVHSSPVVFLHGGPGVSDLARDAGYFGRLTADGFDVYVYDQLGTGASTRLDDPTGYGVPRDVADLEQIRRQVGADRLVLIGHSYGGFLAASYLAAHPDHVERLLLLSPGPLDPADTSAAGVQGHLDLGQRLRVYAVLARPRALLAYALLQVSPRAAHEYYPDDEADGRNDRVLEAGEPALHCPHAGPPDRRRDADGFHRLQYPQSATAPHAPDPRPRLTGSHLPVLVVKGSCDYLSWHSALDYRAALPDTTLVYLPGAGHNVYEDLPGAVETTVRAFLVDAPLPFAPYRGTAAPAGYRGPP